jgi:hypothetical protein
MATFAADARAQIITGLTTSNALVTFNAATPGTLLTGPTPITGLAAGQIITNIDFRPADGTLVGLSFNGATGASSLFSINPVTGAATSFNNFSLPTNPSFINIDFNPVANALRIVTGAGGNFRVTAGGTGTFVTDTSLNPGTPVISAIAYDRNFPGATQTTLYDIDILSNTLFTQGSVNGTPVSPNAGTLFSVAPLSGIPASSAIGFDISGATGTAYLLRGGPAGSDLYTLNLATGQATLAGGIAAAISVVDITAAPVPEPGSLALFGVFATMMARRFTGRRGIAAM